MTTPVRIAFLCPDRIGLVAAVAARLFDFGADLGDISFTVLGESANFTAVCDIPADLDLETLERELKGLEQLKDAELTVSRFKIPSLKAVGGAVTHRLVLTGGNRPGLIARLSEALIDYRANVVHLTAEVIPGGTNENYVIAAAVSIPSEKTHACLATMDNVAQQLSMTLSVETA